MPSDEERGRAFFRASRHPEADLWARESQPNSQSRGHRGGGEGPRYLAIGLYALNKDEQSDSRLFRITSFLHLSSQNTLSKHSCM